MRRLTQAVGGSLLDGEKYVGSSSMAKRKSADAPPAGDADGVAETPWLGAGVPHALAKIATTASSPIVRRVCRLIVSSSCATSGVPVRHLPEARTRGGEAPYAGATPDRAAPAIASGVTSVAKWQATRCPGRISRNSGTSVSHSCLLYTSDAA